MAAFGYRKVAQKTYPQSYCKACIVLHNKTTRSNPVTKAHLLRRRRERWRYRYRNDEQFRSNLLARSREVAATKSVRAARVRKLLDHFEGRPGWIAQIAEILLWQSTRLSYIDDRIETLLARHVGDI